jgi:N-acyl-D-aspartate/D-glutamate deacylase
VRTLTENGADGGFSWLKAVGYGGLRIVTSPQEASLVGKNIELLAKDRHVEGFDLLADLAMKHDAIRLTMADIDEDDVRLIMVQPWTMIASDGNGIDAARDSHICEHPRSLGTFPRVLGHYARELGVLSLPDAVRKMTTLPASYLHLNDRGQIALGRAADITVFDPQRVMDRATYEKPCELSVGIEHVFVNGVAVYEGGKVTGALPGQFVPRQGK